MIGSCATSSCHHGARPIGPVAIELTTPPHRPEPTQIPWYHLVDTDSPLVFLVENSALFEISDDVLAGLARPRPEGAGRARPLPAKRPLAQRYRAPACAASAVAECGAVVQPELCLLLRRRRTIRRSAATDVGEVAHRAVDDLIDSAAPGDCVLIGFIGGEPMINRSVVHDCVGYATDPRGRRRGERAVLHHHQRHPVDPSRPRPVSHPPVRRHRQRRRRASHPRPAPASTRRNRVVAAGHRRRRRAARRAGTRTNLGPRHGDSRQPRHRRHRRRTRSPTGFPKWG